MPIVDCRLPIDSDRRHPIGNLKSAIGNDRIHSVKIIHPGGKLRSQLKTHALGLLAIALAVFVRWLLDPVMGDALPLVTIFAAVAVAI